MVLIIALRYLKVFQYISVSVRARRTFHAILNSFLASFSFHTCFDSSVLFLLLTCRKDVV